MSQPDRGALAGRLSRPRLLAAVKLLAAVLLLSTLALVAGRSLAPDAAWWLVLAVAAGAGAVIVSLAALGAVVAKRAHRFLLNHGGTDAQWMWWGGEPPGLQRERRAAEAARADVKPDAPPESASQRR